MLYAKKFRPKIKVGLKGKEPHKVCIFGEWSVVTQVIEQWAMTGEWWRQENKKMFWRLQLEGDRVMEIFQDLVTGDWWLYKIWD
ncbi:MAG: hypothetical protein ABFD08_08175 [Syntrophomonas sp.]